MNANRGRRRAEILVWPQKAGGAPVSDPARICYCLGLGIDYTPPRKPSPWPSPIGWEREAHRLVCRLSCGLLSKAETGRVGDRRSAFTEALPILAVSLGQAAFAKRVFRHGASNSVA